MSASLVGSEMCIRDRRTSGRRWATSLSCSLTPTGSSSSSAGSGSRSAVSYTHLTLPTICSV
eukprot:7940024-Alexandrium_andersonii.AAC.1